VQKTLGNQPKVGENESSPSGASHTERALTTRAAKDSDRMADSESTTGRSPAFQFYPSDFLSDQNVIPMSLQERGAYITLICLAWQNPLPADVSRLAALCGVPLPKFKKIWSALAVCFRPHPDNAQLLVHPRLEREREKQNDYRRRQSDAAAKRWQSRGNATASMAHVPDLRTGNALISSSSLSSSSDFSQGRTERVPSRARGMGPGVMAGMLPRDHLRHAWCGRVCVPEFLHARFVGAIGGSSPDTALRSFYTETFEDIPDSQSVESDPLKFWPPRVSARWPGQGASEGTRTQALKRASVEFMRDQH
jgi:uncharacterized protein YdaU (DUF1376 family)